MKISLLFVSVSLIVTSFAQQYTSLKKEILEIQDTLKMEFFFGFSHGGWDEDRNQHFLDYFRFHKEIRKIQLIAHTDCRGSDKQNEILSLRRAEWIKEHLLELVDSSLLIETIGLGESTPRIISTDSGNVVLTCTLIKSRSAKEEQETLFQLNRRTEIIILEVDSSLVVNRHYENIEFSPIRVGNIYELSPIWFDFAKWTLIANDSVNSVDSLEILADFMRANPNTVIEIMNHTDCRGSDKYSIRLSQKRAESIKECLIEEYGIPSDRLIAKGYEGTLPKKIMDENGDLILLTCTYISKQKNLETQEKLHQMNRRTEFKIVSLDYKSR